MSDVLHANLVIMHATRLMKTSLTYRQLIKSVDLTPVLLEEI